MQDEVTYIFSGILFGLSGGLTPGPLMTLVVTQSLRYGAAEGVKIALSPLLTDTPLVTLSILLIASLSNISAAIGVLALFGALFLVYLGFETLRYKPSNPEDMDKQPNSIRKGILANFLNPNPYLFWMTVGAPLVIQAAQQSLTPAILFIFFMYLCLVGSKVIVARLIGRSRDFLNNRIYMTIMRFLAILLFLFAIKFMYDGLVLLEIFEA